MIKYLFFVCLLWSGTIFSQDQATFYFDVDQDYLNRTSEVKFTRWLQDNQQIKISRIEAYCDSTASFAYNKRLANSRAEHIKKRLEENTILIDSTAIVVAFGDDFIGATQHGIHRKVVVFYQKIVRNSDLIIPSLVQNVNTVNPLEAPVTLTSIDLTTQLQKAKAGEFIILQNVNFKFNSEVMVDPAADILKELLRFMQLEPTLKIEIQGHICCNSDPKDIKLSTRRAKAVRDYLISNGISQQRLSYKGFGSNKPLFILPEKNEKERAANRRVEILIVQK
ncbi:OmpA family protein [Flavobacterium sp. F-328]|uniref:OmpA family protein n=1 Tax=Flavobacterium erciyesense TaxID=2825842 RepID=A0ABS5D791_9FLAO|nr:OmpA family protein [Flavobacterium erciyesense]MBQ0909908.1 OmpA family protein [Flavobacterium erciyesense]